MRNFWRGLQTEIGSVGMMCLCAVCLIGNFQSIGTAREYPNHFGS